MDNRKTLLIATKKDFAELKNISDPAGITDLHIRKASEFEIDFSVFLSVKEVWIDSKQAYQIPDSFLQLQQLQKLIINGNCLLPQDIHLLKNLDELWLEDKAVINPPHNIIKAASIRKLNIAYYDNIEPAPVPEWIFDMTQLEKICFSVCRFTHISSRINQLKNLVELDFGCSLSDLVYFPDLSGLTKLKRLIIKGESVQGQKLPSYSLFPQVLDAIKNLSWLEFLNLSDWRPKRKADWLVVENKRYSIPDVFNRYPQLKELLLCNMNIDFIPSGVLHLKNLKYLSVMGNKFDNDEVRKIIQHLPHCIIDSDVIYYKPRKK